MLFKLLLAQLARDRWAYGLIAAYALIAIMTAKYHGFDWGSSYVKYLITVGLPSLVILPAAAVIWDFCAVVDRLDRRRRLALRMLCTSKRMANVLSALALFQALIVFMSAFTVIKNLLPQLRGGFLYDRSQADFDAWLHFGVAPSDWLAPLYQNALVIRLLGWNYSVPFFFICFFVFFQIARQSHRTSLRSRYVVSSLLIYALIGNVFAGLFLSGGPAFYGVIDGDHSRFDDLRHHLGIDLNATGDLMTYYSYLWQLHLSGDSGLGSGISAFPSVHVALAVRMALFAWEHSRWLGIAASIYSIVILLSSVVLGWHYAIDGYASALLVGAIYWATKWIWEAAPKPITDTPGYPAWTTAPQR